MPDIGIIAPSRDAAALRERRQINKLADQMELALRQIELAVCALPKHGRLYILNHALEKELGPAGVKALGL